METKATVLREYNKQLTIEEDESAPTKEKEEKEYQTDKKEEDIFKTEEIRIEEMAIDGICGVYQVICPAMASHMYHDLSMSDPECIANLKPKMKKIA